MVRLFMLYGQVKVKLCKSKKLKVEMLTRQMLVCISTRSPGNDTQLTVKAKAAGTITKIS